MPDGNIQALTLIGAAFIQHCALDRPELVAFRQNILDTITLLTGKEEAAARDLLRRYLAWPDNLPDLSGPQPPDDNSRKPGIAQSAFAARQRGELPATY